MTEKYSAKTLSKEAIEARQFAIESGIHTALTQVKESLKPLTGEEKVQFLSSLLEKLDDLYDKAWEEVHGKQDNKEVPMHFGLGL